MTYDPQAHAAAAYREYVHRVEEACELAIVQGCGVLVDRSTWPWQVEVSIAVPYGELHYLPIKI